MEHKCKEELRNMEHKCKEELRNMEDKFKEQLRNMEHKCKEELRNMEDKCKEQLRNMEHKCKEELVREPSTEPLPRKQEFAPRNCKTEVCPETLLWLKAPKLFLLGKNLWVSQTNARSR